MNTYYHKHPRNFANECDILVATTTVERKAAIEHDYERITVADLKKHISWINTENDSWGSNRAFGKITWENMLENGALMPVRAIKMTTRQSRALRIMHAINVSAVECGLDSRGHVLACKRLSAVFLKNRGTK